MSGQLKNRKIILGVTGGIAAYKACTLCRLLIKAGADVYVVMTPAATKLVTAATFEALSGHPVAVNVFEDTKEISHIAIGKNADLLLIAPATANTIAKIAAGFADNMLTTVTLAATCPIAVAPAMNVNMYKNQATQDNLKTLARRGFYILTPNSGDLACGVDGIGRMKEPFEIFEDILTIFSQRLENKGLDSLPSPDAPLELMQTKLLGKASGAGLNVLITAGPTVEDLDPVRYLSNKSSGKMGFNLAVAAAKLGANVTLVTGPVTLPTPNNVRRIDVRNAVQMLSAVEEYADTADIFISCAAVADFRAQKIANNKIKKQQDEDEITITLVKNPDIVATIAKREQRRPFTVGFAAETENLEENAKSKLVRKNLDLIVLNDVSNQEIGFNSNENEVNVYDKDGMLAHFEKQSKAQLASELVKIIFEKAKKDNA